MLRSLIVSTVFAAMVLVLALPAPRAYGATIGDKQRQANYVWTTAVYMDTCIRADSLLRDICGRFGARPDVSAASKARCDLPGRTFQARTEASYRRFRDRHAADLVVEQAAIAEMQAKVRQSLERQFPQALAGRLAGLELEQLSRVVREEHCQALESRLLLGD